MLMRLEDNIRQQFNELCSSGNKLSKQPLTNTELYACDQYVHQCQAWLAAAQNLTHLIFANTSNPYKTRIDKLCELHTGSGWAFAIAVGSVTAILEQLMDDLDKGLIPSIQNQIKALIFDDFLDQARKLAIDKKLRESGTLTSIIFEDSIRTICRNNDIEERGNKLDDLISQLAKKDVLNVIKAKRARAAAGVRNKCLHAQWNDVDLSDINSTIKFIEQLISMIKK